MIGQEIFWQLFFFLGLKKMERWGILAHGAWSYLVNPKSLPLEVLKYIFASQVTLFFFFFLKNKLQILKIKRHLQLLLIEKLKVFFFLIQLCMWWVLSFFQCSTSCVERAYRTNTTNTLYLFFSNSFYFYTARRRHLNFDFNFNFVLQVAFLPVLGIFT